MATKAEEETLRKAGEEKEDDDIDAVELAMATKAEEEALKSGKEVNAKESLRKVDTVKKFNPDSDSEDFLDDPPPG